MEKLPINILLVEDNPGDALLIQETLREADGQFNIQHTDRLSTALEHLHQLAAGRIDSTPYTTPVTEGDSKQPAGYPPIDVVLLDLALPDSQGIDTFYQVQEEASTIPIVLLTGLDDEALAVKAVREGAQDYLVKGQVDGRVLAQAIRYAIERKRAEDAIYESEERYRIVSELTSDFAYAFEMRPNGTLKLIWVTEAFQRITGFHTEEFETFQSWLVLGHPEDRESVHNHIKTVLKGEPHDIEVRIITRAHEVRWVSLHDRPVWNAKAQKVSHIYGAAQDITNRKQSEEALRRYAEEQAALYEVNSAVTASLEIEALFDAVLKVVIKLWKADASWITLPNSGSDNPLHIVAKRGLPDTSLLIKGRECPHLACPTYQLESPDNEKITIIHTIDHTQFCPMSKELADAGFKSQACIPLITGERVLGVLDMAWREPPDGLKLDRKLLVTIGRQIGIALHNAQLYQSARQVDRLRVLNDLDQALSATLDKGAVAEVALRKIAAALDASEGMLMLYNQDTDMAIGKVLILSKGQIDTDTILEFSETEHAQLHVFSRWLDQRTETDPLPLSQLEILPPTFWDRPKLKRLKKGGMLIPIWGEGHLIALLALSERNSEQPFTDEDHALARAAAGRAGQAIQNARLYDESQSKSDRLATLNAISAAAVAWLDMDTVLNRILDLTCQAVNAKEGIILLKNPTGNLPPTSVENNTDGEARATVTPASKVTPATQYELHVAWTMPVNNTALLGAKIKPGQGIAGWVAQRRQAILVNDPYEDPRFYSSIDQKTGFTTHSLMCAPLIHRDKLTGVIEVVNKRADSLATAAEFTPDDLSLLESVSSIAAMALENARLYTATRERAKELESLNKIGLSLTSTLNFFKVVQVALNHVQRLFQAESVSLIQPDPETGKLHFVRTLEGKTPVPIPVELKPGEGLAGWVLEHQKAILVQDAQQDARFSSRVDQHTGKSTHAVIAVPLIVQNRAIGVLEVISSKIGVYTAEELQTLQALASTFSVALQNARLYDELRTLLLEREKSQAQLIHAEKMSALGRLIASIAHEINNPLQAVEGCLTLVTEELQEDPPDKTEMKQYLDIAESEIRRISSIVRRLRDFYRPPRHNNQPTDLHAVLESVLALTAKQLQHSAITVERHWATDLPQIPAKADHLKQVFLNLVINAIDAMPDGGKLQVTTSLDDVDIEGEHQETVCIEFTDTGVGMAPNTLANLFEPFFTTKEQGSGLGLSISYGIIKGHNGKFTASSELGKGTTFTIWLPLHERPDED